MTAAASKAPDRRVRILVALLIGALAVALTIFKQRALVGWRTTDASGPASDFDQVRFAALAFWQGRDPYALIGPGREFDWHWPLFYPLTSAVAALPFAALSALVARCAFIGGSAAALAYGLTTRSWHRLVVLASPWGLYAIHLGQWTPSLTAALALAPGLGPGIALGLLIAAKPTVGIAMLAGVPLASEDRGSVRRTFVAAACVVVVTLVASLAAQPHWPAAWLASLRSQHHLRPIVVLPAGALVLLALLRWRRPEARMLVALACVPQTSWWYDALPLALVAESRTESLVFALAGWAAYAAFRHIVPPAPGPEGAFALAAQLTVVFAYLPCLVMVLVRANEGAVPAWVERAASSAAGRARTFAARVGRRSV